MIEPFLHTERLRLRAITPDDVEHLVLLNSDEDVMRFIDRQPPTRAEVVAEIASLVAARQSYPQHGTFAAEDRHGAFVGWFALKVNAAGPSAPELGYRLRRSAWGQGLATEGGQALIDHAFTRLGADRVTAETMFVNTASRRVMEKCGMHHVKTFHVHFDDPLPGTELGEVLYEITRAQWSAARRQAR